MGAGGRMTGFFASRVVRWLAVFVLAIIVAGIAEYSYRQINEQLTDAALSQQETVARLTALTLAERFGRDVDIGIMLAAQPRLQNLVSGGQWDAAARYLRRVPTGLAHIKRVFLADPAGTLRADTPALAGVQGVNFAYREWYKGVRNGWRPYITSVYRRTAAPRIDVFAVAVPIRSHTGVVAGILVLQVDASTLLDWVGSATAGGKSQLYVVDEKGQGVHRSDKGSPAVVDLSRSPIVESLHRGADGASIEVDARNKEKDLVAYAAAAGYGWGVVLKQPVRTSAGLAARDAQLWRLLSGYGVILLLGAATILFAARLAVERQRARDDRRLVAEQQRAAQALAAKDRLLSAVGSMAKVGGWEFDARTYKGTWTDEVSRIHDLEPGVETNAEIGISYYHGESRARIEAAVKDAIEHAKPYDLELELVTAKGARKWVRTIGQPVVENGVVVKVWGSFQDITARKNREHEIRELNAGLERKVHERTAELEAVNHELEAFSYSVSHDLRAPLRAIDGFSQALLDDYAERLDDAGKQFLARVRAATQRMGELIDDLLELSRVTRAEITCEPVDLSALAETVVADLRQSEPDRRVEAVIRSGMHAQGDRGLLRIALVNLLSNAWKFTAHKADARVELGVTDTGDNAAFFVRDNGVGFDMHYATKLFGAFQRLHPASEYPGTGVGLATVQRVIRRHGGQVWAEAAVDCGASFYFTLPQTLAAQG